MKKVSIILLSLLLLLTGCKSSQIDKTLKEAEEATNKKQYDVAIAKYAQVLQKENTNATAREKLIATREAKYNDLYNAGQVAMENGDYEMALAKYEEAFNFDKEKNPELKDQIQQLKNNAKELTAINEYMTWSNEIAKKNYELQNQWRNASDSFSISQMSKEEFVGKIEALVPISNGILGEVEKKLFELSPELQQVHTGLLSEIKKNHEIILKVIIDSKIPEITPIQLTETGKELTNIQNMQAIHIQNIKSYAESKGVKMK